MLRKRSLGLSWGALDRWVPWGAAGSGALEGLVETECRSELEGQEGVVRARGTGTEGPGWGQG